MFQKRIYTKWQGQHRAFFFQTDLFCIMPFDLLCLHFNFSSIYRLNRIARVGNCCLFCTVTYFWYTLVISPVCFICVPADRVLLWVQWPTGERHGQGLHLEVLAAGETVTWNVSCHQIEDFKAADEMIFGDTSWALLLFQPFAPWTSTVHVWLKSPLLLQSGSHHRIPALHAPPQCLCVLCGLGSPGSRHDHMGLRREGLSVCSVCHSCMST